MKIVVYLKPDLIAGVVYNAGEICGWPDHIADKLIEKDFAKLWQDGKVKEAGGKVPGSKDFWTTQEHAEHLAALKKEGKWTPAPAPVLMDPEVARAFRDRARAEQNQI